MLTVPPDLPPTYRGESIGWGYEVEIADETTILDAADLTVTAPTEPTTSGARVLEEPSSRRRSWVETGARTDAGTSTTTVLGTLGLGILILALGVGGPSWFGVALGALLIAIGSWFGRDLAVKLRRSFGEIEVSVDTAIVRPGEPVRVRVGPHERDGLQVGLVAVELSLVSHRQTIVGQTGLERWTAADPGEHELPTRVDDPASYQGERVALVWFVALRDGSLPDKARRLTERRTPITLDHWQRTGDAGSSTPGAA